MRISVIITTYNRARLLGPTLAHLRRQAFEPGDEVIVVDNGSTDDTPDVIARARADFPTRFLAITERTPGKTPALIAGINLSAGDVLALTDDDVLVDPDWMATIRQLFRDDARDLVGGRVDPLWERPAPSWLQLESDGIYGQMASPLALLHYGAPAELRGRTAVGANLIVRRTVYEALAGFAPHLGRRRGTLLCGEDHDFCLRAAAAGYRCEYRPELRVRHHVPAARTRFTYYLRWFFWSGVTTALLDAGSGSGHARATPGYLGRRIATCAVAAVRHLLARRPAQAAPPLMEVAFALGYVSELAGRRQPLARLGLRPSGAGNASGKSARWSWS